jgi:hypothetical protein
LHNDAVSDLKTLVNKEQNMQTQTVKTLYNLEDAIKHIAKHFPAYDQYTKAEN